MTLRKVLIGIAAVLLIAMAVPIAFADTTPTVPANTQPALTQDQVKEVRPILDKMLELKRELFQKYVDMGIITQEDADARIDLMEQNQKSRIENGFVPGMGRGCGGRGGFGGGCGGGGCYNGTVPAPAAPTSGNLL